MEERLSAGLCVPERRKSISSFELRKQLGKGWLGRVYHAIRREDGTEYAIKKVPKSKIRKEEVEDHIREEIRINGSLRHPNIVEMTECIEDSRYIYLVMERCDSDLSSYMSSCGGKISEEEAMSYFVQLLDAIDYLHQLNIYHRDIKPENVLKTADGIVKLCDFGFAAKSARRRETLCGTAEYMAPEMVRHEPYRHKIDIWSLGCLLYELVTGDVPFGERDEGDECETNNDCEYHSLYHRILERDLRIPRYISWEMKDLIHWMLQKNASHRPSTGQLKAHRLVMDAQRRLLDEDKENGVDNVMLPCAVVIEKLSKSILDSLIVKTRRVTLVDNQENIEEVKQVLSGHRQELRARDSRGRAAVGKRSRYNLRKRC